MRLSAVLVAATVALGCSSAAGAQEFSLSTAKNIYRAAKLICAGTYGNVRPAKIDQGTLKYYCARALHPESWLQDLEWWKANAPSFLQAAQDHPARMPKLPPLGPDPFDRINKLSERLEAIRRCRIRGGSERDCEICGATPTSVMCKP
jgi:hypothetical protein